MRSARSSPANPATSRSGMSSTSPRSSPGSVPRRCTRACGGECEGKRRHFPSPLRGGAGVGVAGSDLGLLQLCSAADTGHPCPARGALSPRPPPGSASGRVRPPRKGEARRAVSAGTLLRPGAMALADWRAIYFGAPVALDEGCRAAVQAGAATIDAILAKHEPVYGINTGFGKLASVRIPDGDLAQLQRNLVLSHAAGVGEPLAAPVVRLMMALKLANLGQGASGVRWATLTHLLACLKRGLVPVVPAQGSVGASGDLAPLAHLAAALIGEGEILLDGARLPAREALAPRRPRADRARSEGGPRAPQRHAGLDRARARRPVRGRARVPGRARHRRARDRRGARLGRAVRRPHPSAAPPPRPDRGRGGASRPDARQRHPRLASYRRRPHPGPVLPALPAAGDGRLPRPPAPGRRDARDGGERRLRQPAGLSPPKAR